MCFIEQGMLMLVLYLVIVYGSCVCFFLGAKRATWAKLGISHSSVQTWQPPPESGNQVQLSVSVGYDKRMSESV